MKKDKAFHGRWTRGGQAISQLYVSLMNAPFEQYEREFLELQRSLLVTSAKTVWEKKETRRRIAEEILMGAWGTNCSWEDFGRALRRIQRLGYTNAERRLHVAILFARWAQQHPAQLNEARRMLDLAERHALALSAKHPQSRDIRRGLDSIRQEREFTPRPAPAPSKPAQGE